MNDYFTRRQQCPCCNSSNGTELCRIPYTSNPLRAYLVSFYSPQGGVEFDYLENQDYVLVACSQCGLIYQSEIPNDFLMHKLYDQWIDPHKCFEHYERNRGIQYFAKLSAEIVKIVEMLNRPPLALKFLDYSMGWGHWCRIARSFGIVVHGTEFSRSRVEYARNEGITVIGYEEIGKQKYDFINTEQVFEHLPNIKTTLLYLAGSLKPDGILKISVPDGGHIKHNLEALDWGNPDSLNPVAPLEHVNCFNYSSLLTLAEGCGLLPFVQKRNEAVGRKPRGIRQTAKALISLQWNNMKGVRTTPSTYGTYMFFRLANTE